MHASFNFFIKTALTVRFDAVRTKKSRDYVNANINNTATATFLDNHNIRNGIRDFQNSYYQQTLILI